MGSRMKTSLPKQFHLFLGKPLLYYSLKAFNLFSKKIKILVVLPNTYIEQWINLCEKYSINIKHHIVEGGETRFQSVKNALLTIKKNDGLVAIHDGVRPLISNSLIKKCYSNAFINKSAIPVIPLEDSIIKISNNLNVFQDRRKFNLVQTPQCFELSLIKKAYMLEYKKSFTDDASVFESFGKKVYTFQGEKNNLKITYPSDTLIAETLYKNLYL